jgi:ABC-2 type transport system ATP-binding protein
VRGDAAIIQAAIERIDNVKKIIANPTTSDWLNFSILCDSGTDSREKVAELANQYGWPIRSLHRHRSTLEEVFVELTRQD